MSRLLLTRHMQQRLLPNLPWSLLQPEVLMMLCSSKWHALSVQGLCSGITCTWLTKGAVTLTNVCTHCDARLYTTYIHSILTHVPAMSPLQTETRGTVNGIGQSLGALGRTVGPILGSMVFAWSEINGQCMQEHNTFILYARPMVV